MPTALQWFRRSAPPGVRVRQRLSSQCVEDVYGTTLRRLHDTGVGGRVARGAAIGITAGSRGSGGLVEILRATADFVRHSGGDPFILPAMGSHGGAVAAGQVEILARLGITPSSVHAPVRATMDTVALGVCDSGATAHFDDAAFRADGVIVIGRTKTHPESTSTLASGLLKMMTVGLGNQAGAREAHAHGLWESVRGVPELQLAGSNVLCGISVVENAFRRPAVIEVVPPSYPAFLDADCRLLDVAKKHAPSLPFDRLDLLIMDQFGKTVSGTGMDLHVIDSRTVRRLAALSLTPPSLGNALGAGYLDFITDRFAAAVDLDVTYTNLLTSVEPGGDTAKGRLPLALPTDRAAIEVALGSALAGPSPRLCRITSTAELAELWISEGLLAEARANPELTVLDERAAPLPYDQHGELLAGHAGDMTTARRGRARLLQRPLD